MTTEMTPLALRREALIARCALQRMNAANEVRDLLEPFGGAAPGLGGTVPLTIAGVALGLLATRAGRLLPMITVGMSVWKLARSALALLRKP